MKRNLKYIAMVAIVGIGVVLLLGLITDEPMPRKFDGKSLASILPDNDPSATSAASPDGGEPQSQPTLPPSTAPVQNFGEPTGLAAAGGREFALDLYAHLAAAPDENGKNLFFSPYSIFTVLIMATEGARGETAEQMGRVLHFPKSLRRERAATAANPWDLASLHMDMAAVAQSLKSPFDPYELNVTNAIWIEKSYPLQKQYLDVISRFYLPGGVFPVDFLNGSDAARFQINDWVKRQTNGRISEVISAGGVNRKTGLVLIDAVYFKGEWLKPFQKSAMVEEVFAAGPDKVSVPMMHEDKMDWARYGEFNADGSFFKTPTTIPDSKLAHADDPDDPSLYPGKGGCTVLEMPYKGNGLSMVVILPQDVSGLATLEKALTSARFDDWAGKLVRRDVNVFFPKFRLDTDYDMVPTLEAMGMSRAFVTPGEHDGAEFEGICEGADPKRKPFISNVLHKAIVDVNEKGTEAAAVTAFPLDLDIAAATDESPFVPTFRANKPFIFAIRDAKTGTILFLGRVMNPLQ